ncbi:MAG TPA: hypothetical protein VEB67_00085, partial [Nitrososphaerales archaeon]|nr:hypothetical protein [Nitrososphaerales archaeon]
MTPRFEVAVMHDFFIDRLVHTRSLRRLSQSMESKAKSGGGGIHGVRQSEVRGGNAVNLAHALGRLGVRTLLITHSEPAHAGMLLEAFDGLPVEVRVKDASAGLTVAFEERTNVMLGDVAGAGRFGPEMLDVEDWRSLNGCSVVCSANWAANSMGTKLLVALRKKLPAGTKVFLDPADFRDRVPDFNRLLRKI